MPDHEIVEEFQYQHAALLALQSEGVTEAWFGLGSWDDTDVARFIDAVDPFTVAVRSQLVDLVDGYLAELARLDPIGLTARIPIAQPRALPPETVWRRPFITHWQALSQGVRFTDANTRGSVRAVTIAQHDAQIVTRAAIAEAVDYHTNLPDEVFETAPRPEAPETASIAPETAPAAADDAGEPEPPGDDTAPRRLVGYRRVLSGKSCMFCAAAATRRYYRRDLMPLHAKCDCSVAPVFADSDPGDLLNKDLLRALKARGPEYWKARGFVDNEGQPLDPTDVPASLGRSSDHPEVGPVLTHT